MTIEQKSILLQEIQKLHERNEFSKKIAPDYYEPGMMEYLDKSDGLFEKSSGKIILHFEAKGTRHNGRTEHIETVTLGDQVIIVRDRNNKFNSNNFLIMTKYGQDIGTLPADLCNTIAPLYDSNELIITESSVSYVEPISKRNRYAKQAILFIEMVGRLISR